MTREQLKQDILADINKLTLKKPFFRGSGSWAGNDPSNGEEGNVNVLRKAALPRMSKTVISQDQMLKEFDAKCHKIHFDTNVPSICVKASDGTYHEIEFKKMGVPLQKRILEKHVLHAAGNPVQFLLKNSEPSEKDVNNFATFKKYWVERNQDGMRTKALYTQQKMGDVALLFYHDYKGRIKSRILCYEDGYVIISHNDQNGDRLLETIYYEDSKGIQHLDSYDDTYLYRKVSGSVDGDNNGWQDLPPKKHGFSEIPVATKRGDVAWNDVQDLIEVYEIIYNIFLVIQKRHGWGILYIKGNFSENAKKIAGSIILNDTSLDGSGSAEFKTPPNPEHMIETLESLYQQIQIGSSTTFLLPKDVKSSGDVSALAIMLTQSLDIEGATNLIHDYQNFADKCCRLFKEGLAKELVDSSENKTAITDFEKLDITAYYKIWRPFSEYEYNQMLQSLYTGKGISQKTFIEKNTISAPDEEIRIKKETEEAERKAQEKAEQQMKMQQQTANNNNPTEE